MDTADITLAEVSRIVVGTIVAEPHTDPFLAWEIVPARLAIDIDEQKSDEELENFLLDVMDELDQA